MPPEAKKYTADWQFDMTTFLEKHFPRYNSSTLLHTSNILFRISENLPMLNVRVIIAEKIQNPSPFSDLIEPVKKVEISKAQMEKEKSNFQVSTTTSLCGYILSLICSAQILRLRFLIILLSELDSNHSVAEVQDPSSQVSSQISGSD